MRESTKKIFKCKQKKVKLAKEHKEPIKRTKHPENWKVNIKKNARLRGEEYIGVGGNYSMDVNKHSAPCNQNK